MANKDDYLTSYRKFFEYFAQTVNPNDQLPVKLGCYKLLNVEVIGGIIDWTSQYLSQKKCPPHLYSPLIKIIIEEIRICCKQNPHNYGFNSTDNAYEPLKLMQAVMAKTNEVCLRYRDNSMLCSLPVPSTTYYETSIFAIRNRRRKMEDRHVAIHDLNTMFNVQEASPSSYYAIFDGHAGHDAAAYSAAHLHQFLAENKYFMSNPEQALLDAFCKTDALFLEKCKVENLTGGTTALVALLRPKEKSLYIAWVGDSQALLVKQGKALQCVNPHKPSREDERQRIEKAGGCVMLWGTWRVNGQLAVSRAIGDADYKPHVIAIPDVREISLDGGEDFLIMACDGLWDFVSENAAAHEVYYMVAQNPDDTEIIGRHLSQLARYQGSTDNISVIVVFLKEPHQIAAEAHRLASLHGPTLTTDNNMETGLDNANNPFTNSNGSLKNLEVDTDNIELRKDNDGLMLNLADSFKSNVRGIKQELFMTEKSNGTKNSASDIHFDDDFGPETDVDAIDDAFSPLEKEEGFTGVLTKGLQEEAIPNAFNDEVKAFTEGLANNNPPELDSNPFLDDQNEKAQKRAEMNFEDFCGANREETPTPPIDAVHDVGGLEVNPTESDSEDEWNYIKGDQAKPETLSSQPETVVETSEQEDAMSQLNPDAAEFVPISPTRSIPSPACRTLINEEVLSQSPKQARKIDISLPSEDEFELELKSRPKDCESFKNGHESDSNNTLEFEEIEKMLNSKNKDELLKIHTESTPNRQLSDEFHFGPNATPFTPKTLDQSDAFSTKANHGDETQQTLDDSEFVMPSGEQTDPMSMSFYAEKGESNPFEDEDLNRVHILPDNLEEFIGGVEIDKENPNVNDPISEQFEPKPFEEENVFREDNLDKLIENANEIKDNFLENSKFDDTISDLPEHHPLGKKSLDNDEAIQITDLDKISQDDEKELASPVEENEELLDMPSNDNVFQKNVEVAILPEEFELVNAPLYPPVLEQELLAESSSIQSQSLVPEKNEQEPFLNDSKNLVCEFTPGNEIFETDSEVPKSPVCELKSASPFLETEVNLKNQVENIQSNIEEVTSTLACEYTATSPVPVCEEAASPVLVCESSVINESCEIVSKESTFPEPKQDEEIVSLSPNDLLQDLKQDEDVTCSIKDDVSSPIEPLSPVKMERKEDGEVTSSVEDFVSSPIDASPNNLQKSLLEEIATAGVHESTFEAHSSETECQNIVPDLLCPLPFSQPILAPTKNESQTIEFNQISALSNGFNNFSSELNEQICIKTDTITPEFAEPTVITPSEESKIDDILVENVPTPEPTIAENLIEVPKTHSPKEIAAVAPSLQDVKSVKDEKKTTSARKSIGKVELKKPTGSKVGATKAPTAAKVGLSSAKPPTKLGTAKPTGATTKITATTATALKAAPKPKTTSRLTEKKPAPNGEVKPAPRTAITKKPSTEAPATKTTTRPATAAAKTTPTKTTAPRPATAPRTLAPKAAPANLTTATAPKPRVPLSSRTVGTASKTTTAATTKKTTTTASKSLLAPKPATAAPPKPKTLASSPFKPRVPLTKTVMKSADVEKEKKESANKLTASRTTTTTRTTSGAATTRTTTTTVKKTETKLSADRTSQRANVTVRKTPIKKTNDVVKTTITKTTKVEKPKENGVAPTNVTQEIKEITIVNNVINQSESQTEDLVKDNSPLDNKMLIDPNNALLDANPAD